MPLYIDSPDSLLASFESETESGRLILVTGESGLGKTRWCLALAAFAKARGICPGGLVSPAVFKGNRKIGIDLLDLDSGLMRHLAARRGESDKGQITEYWRLDDEVLTWGNNILAGCESCKLLILDELGPLEFTRGSGLTNGIGLITARRYRLACVVVRPSLLDDAQVLWPWGETFFIPYSKPAEAA